MHWFRNQIHCRMIHAALGVLLCVAPLISQRSCCCADATMSRAARTNDGGRVTTPAASRRSCCQHKAGCAGNEEIRSCCRPHVGAVDRPKGDCQCPILRRSSVPSAMISSQSQWQHSYGEFLPDSGAALQSSDEPAADASSRKSPAPPAHHRHQALLCVWRN